MSEVLNIANAVAAELSDYHAEVLFFPEFELRELEEMRVVVVPTGTEYKTLSRAAHEELPKVQVGFLKRGCEDELPELLQLVEGLGLGFLNRRLAGAMCVCVAYNPIYSPEHLRERGQFTSVIELTFKTVKQ
ncbi:MAG: hypothetical protein BWY31_04134 [Lentisphaerae bacterium ADurb.Bin242]|nr:MAG: hypothetical protein BWY31_04134 [Lentisphaerae bacterium ADurb.Bin242]